ncbi:MAG: FAD-dependent oxidoreductase [Clostridia bacterium]|nr:FAD-dependent oxidoreductase [Clostridia bacterium]
MDSVWNQTTELTGFDSLKHDAKTDVLVIGGGLCGILCAYMLEKAGVNYMLVEANKVCSGITKNTTAKITSQHGLVFDKLISRFGVEKAEMYLEANQAAIEQYRQICTGIDCDFEEKDAYLYSVDDADKLQRELAALEKIGFDAQYVHDLPLPIDTVGAIRFGGQAQFHPLKFVSNIIKGLNIYENTKIKGFDGDFFLFDGGRIKAQKTIVATHFPFINKHGSYFLKMYQERSYVLALENAADVNGMYIDEKQGGLSFRNYKNLLLLGGGSHRTGKTGGNFAQLRLFAKTHYLAAKEKYHWATQDCMTLDNVPYIGKYSKNTPDFYVASGFNKWGMTSSMVAANVLTDSILGKYNPYAPIFSPSRTILRPQLAVNAFEAVTNLVRISSPRCPHMGCALKWNDAERSWDCACHGSRFSESGKLIDNPACDDLKQET